LDSTRIHEEEFPSMAGCGWWPCRYQIQELERECDSDPPMKNEALQEDSYNTGHFSVFLVLNEGKSPFLKHSRVIACMLCFRPQAEGDRTRERSDSDETLAAAC